MNSQNWIKKNNQVNSIKIIKIYDKTGLIYRCFCKKINQRFTCTSLEDSHLWLTESRSCSKTVTSKLGTFFKSSNSCRPRLFIWSSCVWLACNSNSAFYYNTRKEWLYSTDFNCCHFSSITWKLDFYSTTYTLQILYSYSFLNRLIWLQIVTTCLVLIESFFNLWLRFTGDVLLD